MSDEKKNAVGLNPAPSFTPGPWVPTQGAHSFVGREFALWEEGHEGNGDHLIASWIKSESNARLIAAAPELYAALERINLFACYASEENTDVQDGMLREIGNAARKAMALVDPPAQAKDATT